MLGKLTTSPIDISPVEIMRQIVRGVHHLHLLKIVHGNLKPSNILISYPKGDLDPVVKVADFGLSHASNDGEEQRFLPACTDGWFCPSDPVDENGKRNSLSDIFAVGLLLGVIASKGSHPHGKDLTEAIERISNQQSRTLTLDDIDETILCRSVPFFNLLDTTLSYDPANRPVTADILAHPFFKIQTATQVVDQEEDEASVSSMESLVLDPSDSDSSSTDAVPTEKTQVMERKSPSTFVPDFIIVPGTSKERERENSGQDPVISNQRRTVYRTPRVHQQPTDDAGSSG